MTDAYAVIGNPISQSKSPFIHGEFARSVGQDMAYTRIEGRVDVPNGFALAVDAFRASGARGMNVTAPFKLDAFAYADVHSRAASLAGAVNALKFEDGRVLADNFDGVGLVRDVVHNLGCAMAGRRVLLLGAGGASRGALLPILEERPACLVIANRNVDKAAELVAIAHANANVEAEAEVKVKVDVDVDMDMDMGDRHGMQVSACSYADLAGQSFTGQGFDIVLNATSSSLQGESLPIPKSVFAPGCLAYDLTYGKGLTPFLQLAQAAGVTHLADGVGMLAEQAAEAFWWWRGVRPDTRAVIAQLTIPLSLPLTLH